MPNLYKNNPYMPHYVTPGLSGGEVGAWGIPASNFVRGIMAKDGSVVYSYTYYAIDLRWLSEGGGFTAPGYGNDWKVINSVDRVFSSGGKIPDADACIPTELRVRLSRLDVISTGHVI